MDYSQMLAAAIGPKENCQKVDTERLEELSHRFPRDLVDLWRNDGWCGYGDGLLWTLDPDEAAPVLADWKPVIPEDATAFARDAFANCFVMVGAEVHRLDVHRGVRDLLALNIEFFFDMKIYDPKFASEVLDKKLTELARKRCGELTSDECYAFVPALALGGSRDANSIRRVKLLEHLALLAQLSI